MNKSIKLSLAASVFAVSNLYAQDNYDLGSITISSATKSEQSIKDVTSNVEVITSAELEEKNIKTLTEALNLVSGVSFTRNGGLGKTTSIRLRGMDTKRTLVLIDGIRYNDITSASGAAFSDIMINDIEKIEIIKGAQSGIWGADASAGVINIITKKSSLGVSGNVIAEYGSFNTKKYGGTLAYKTDKYYLSLSSQRVDSEGFTSYAQKGVDIDSYEDDGYKNTTTNLKFGVNVNDNNKVEMAHTVINSNTQYDSSNADTDNELRTKNKFSSVNFQNIVNDITTDVFVNNSDFQRNYTTGSAFDGRLKEYGVKSHIPYNGRGSFIVAGVDLKKAEHKNDLAKEYKNNGVYLTNSNIINEKFILTESLRRDNYDAFENKTTGKIGIKYNHNHDLSFSTNYGTAYNVPTLYQLYAPLCCGMFPVGNENLKPESVKSYDFTVVYKDIKVTYFINYVKDMIDYDFASGYINMSGESKIKGFEIDYKKTITEDMLFSLSYTRLSTKDSEGFELERRPAETLKFGIDYYAIDKLHLGVNGEYIGDRIEYAYGTHDIDAKTGNYTVVNFTANYDLARDVKIYGKIDNITDKYYQTVEGYATSPRAYYAGVKVSF